MTRKEIRAMPRSQVRYHLYRARTEEDGGCECEEATEEIKNFYEKQKGFGGWNGFARTWDVGKEGDHHVIIERKETEEQEWNAVLMGLVKDLPAQLDN